MLPPRWSYAGFEAAAASGARTNTVRRVSSLESLTVASIAVGVSGNACSGSTSARTFLPAFELEIAFAPT
jgi:hypothetical protein